METTGIIRKTYKDEVRRYEKRIKYLEGKCKRQQLEIRKLKTKHP